MMLDCGKAFGNRWHISDHYLCTIFVCCGDNYLDEEVMHSVRDIDVTVPLHWRLALRIGAEAPWQAVPQVHLTTIFVVIYIQFMTYFVLPTNQLAPLLVVFGDALTL